MTVVHSDTVDGGAPLRFELRRTFAVTPEAIWPLVADTDRLNRVVGFPPIRYATRPRPGGGTHAVAEYVLGRVPLVRWDEAPFEWQYPRRYRVRRDYHWGPLTRFDGGVELTPTVDGGTEVLIWAEMTPRSLIWVPPVKFLVGPLGVRSGINQCVLFERYLKGELDDPFPQLQRRRGLLSLLPPPVQTPFLLAGPRRPLGPPLHHSTAGNGPVGGAILSPAAEQPQPSSPLSTGVERVPGGEVLSGAGPSPLSPRERGPGGEVSLSLHPRVPASGGQAEERLSGPWADLAEESGAPELVERLQSHVLAAPDDAVVKMRPFELADRWGAGRRETLVLFLRATIAGLLQMSWDVMCPNCRLAKAEYGSLKHLATEAHCDTCDITYDANFDRSVEVRFTVSPTVRRVVDTTFCIGGPMNTPHVVAQATVDPGATATLTCRLDSGFYKLRSLQSRGSAIVEATPPNAIAGGVSPTVAETAEPSITVPPSRRGKGARGLGQSPPSIDVLDDRIDPHLITVDAGDVVLALDNRLSVPATLVLERRDWPDTAATAALVSTLQEFRDLFSSEVLAPGIQVAVQRLAFLFTDLSGSTAMYQRAGQAQAFRIVQDHFRLLFAAVNEHRGAIVKTIGDAVMATFPAALDAVEAALAIQREIRRLDTGGAVEPATIVKVGVHQGPCVAVTANETLDYFGTTVNVAARVEHECRGGEITITADVHDDPAVSARLIAGAFRLEPDVVRLRGIREPVRLYRILNPVESPLPEGEG